MWLPFLFQVFQQVYPGQRCQRLHSDLRKSWWCIGCSHSSSMHPLPNQPSLFPCCDGSCNQISYAIAVHLLQYLYWISSWLSFLSICWRKPIYFDGLTPSIDRSDSGLLTSWVRHGKAIFMTILRISAGIVSSGDDLMPNLLILGLLSLL